MPVCNLICHFILHVLHFFSLSHSVSPFFSSFVCWNCFLCLNLLGMGNWKLLRRSQIVKCVCFCACYQRLLFFASRLLFFSLSLFLLLVLLSFFYFVNWCNYYKISQKLTSLIKLLNSPYIYNTLNILSSDVVSHLDNLMKKKYFFSSLSHVKLCCWHSIVCLGDADWLD